LEIAAEPLDELGCEVGIVMVVYRTDNFFCVWVPIIGPYVLSRVFALA